jgi:hypothetical protein
MIADKVGPWSGHQGDELLQQLQWLEKHVARAIGPAPLQFVAERSILQSAQPSTRHRWSRDVPAEPLQVVSSARLDEDLCVKTEPFDAGTLWAVHLDPWSARD